MRNTLARTVEQDLDLTYQTGDPIQEIERLARTDTAPPMKDWSAAGMLRLLPKPGSDLTKILFADFRWVGPEKQ